ncbi:MAG: SDR family oxidoreductase [Clostridia bacterium]|jgi:NADP-dependent 3-hydroxy acid dehydrogenase YdfG|nr:SDR family oxidoreductase [Clostridia bacterium]MBT7123062.1 SDR family oxidoreductase [Clostridia bacterium]
MKDKVVFITGGSEGYGKAAAKLFADRGAKVVIAARTESKLIKAQDETGADSIVCMDVTSAQDWENIALEHVKTRYGRLDVLINNAGGAINVGSLANQTTQTIDQVIALNLNSVIYGSQVFGRMMTKQGSGTIINVASVCAKQAWPGWSLYAAAKWGVLGFSKNLYVEVQPFGVRVTCLLPGAGATDFMQNAGSENMDMQMQPIDVAQAMLSICTLPPHVAVEEMTVTGIDQIIVPL